jgi:prepilin-type N-terminal cleavage/methylation domain-containing protein
MSHALHLQTAPAEPAIALPRCRRAARGDGRARAFTLLEMTVGLAIAGIVLASATAGTVALQQAFGTTRVVERLTSDASFALEHVLRPVRVAGTPAVRPWQAVSTTCIDDGRFTLPACSPADGSVRGRLHVARFEASSGARITALTTTQVQVAALPDGTCSVPVGRSVLLFPSEAQGVALGGPAWLARRCTGALGGGVCGCTLSDTPRAGFDARPTAADVALTAFVGGTLATGTVASYFVDAAGRLSILADLDRSGAAVVTPLIPAVVRFSVRHGYDVNVDGVLDLQTVPPNATSLDALRLLRVGLALSANAPDRTSSGATMFGASIPPVSGKRLVVAEGNAVLRATGVFQ